MNKQKMLLGAGFVMLGMSAAHGASMMPVNPMGTVFAPWNTMPGGFSPLNNGFTSGGPMGMSPFSMSPFGSNGGSPWGSMPSTMMPWNAWSSSPGSVVPWGNQMPLGNFSNFSNNGSGMQMPWGGNNSGMGMPWGNNFNPWSSWAGNRNNPYRNGTNNRDALRSMLLMQELSGQQNLPGLLPGMTGLPSLSGAPMMMAPPQIPANTLPVQPKPQNSFVVQSPPTQFNPFKTPAAPAQPEAPAAVQPVQVQGFSNPFADPVEQSAAAVSKPTGIISGKPLPSFDPFANDSAAAGQQPQNGVQFPDADAFFVNGD